MSEATFTFRVEEDLKSAFTRAAKSEDQTGAQLLRRYMRDFVGNQQNKAAHDIWFRKQVQAGIDSADAGDLVPHEDVEAEATTWRNELQRKLVNG